VGNVKTYHIMVKDSPATSATSPRGARIGFAPPLNGTPEVVGTAGGVLVVAAGMGAARPYTVEARAEMAIAAVAKKRMMAIIKN
jgi:hypothetical protein